MPLKMTIVSTLTGTRRCCFRKACSDGSLMGEQLDGFRKEPIVCSVESRSKIARLLSR